MIKKINTNWYCNFLNLLKLSYIFNFDYIIIIFVKKILVLLNFLLKFNYISHYKFLNNNNVIIYFRSMNKFMSKWNSLKTFYRHSNYIYLNLYNLKKFYNYDNNSILFLSTTKGIKTHKDAIKNKLGGKLIFILY